MASDRGVGLKAGYQAACKEGFWVCDQFHEFQDLFNRCHQLERQAYRAIAREIEAAVKFANAKSEANENRWCPSIAWMDMKQAISENARCTLLMHDTRSASGGSHGVHHMLLSSPAMHALRQTRLGTHLVRRGADRGIPRLLCTKCKGTFSARQGTAYFGVHAEEPNYTIAMRALAEGNSLRGTGRIVEVDKDTVCDWLDRAGRHCRAVTTYLFDNLHITECQVDELWSFVRKKEAHLTVAEKVLALYGDAWVWIAFAPAWRLVAAFVVGKRDQEQRQRAARAPARCQLRVYSVLYQ